MPLLPVLWLACTLSRVGIEVDEVLLCAWVHHSSTFNKV